MRIQRKLGINVDCLRGQLDRLSTMELARKIGFEAITTAGAYTLEEVTALKAKADELRMEFPYLHAPYKGINALWGGDEEAADMMRQITETVDAASACGVPALVFHVSSGWNPPSINDIGLSHFDTLVDYAEKKGVILDIENQRKLGYVTCMMDRYEHRDSVRFCFDCGHAHAMTSSVGWQDIFAHKLAATHIHDNMGQKVDENGKDGDLHWLPLDGTYDYHTMMKKLDKYGYDGPLMLEVFRTRRADYEAMTPEEFLTTAYDRIRRISQMGE